MPQRPKGERHPADVSLVSAWCGQLRLSDGTPQHRPGYWGDAIRRVDWENFMPKNAHTEDAEHHEKAAKSHRAAAEHHEKGDHATASKHADEAHGHSTKAHESSSTAHSKSKK